MTDKFHTVRSFNIYTDHKDGGCVDIAHVQLQGFTLVDNKDLARLRQIAASMDADPIPANIVDVLQLCLRAITGPRGAKPKTRKGLDAYEAVRDLIAANPIARET